MPARPARSDRPREAVPGAPRLLCLGNLTLDDIVRPDGMCRPGCIGGDALYGVLAARLFEPSAEMVAPVGNDLPAHLSDLIDTAGLSRDGLIPRDRPTIHTRVMYETQDRRVVTLVSDDEDFATLSPCASDLPARYWNAEAWMVLAMDLDAQRNLVAACRARGAALVALDPQEEYVAGNEDAIMGMTGGVDVFMPSLDEVRRLLGHEDAAAAARCFAALGPRLVVIKLGAQGCLVHDAAGGRMFRLPAYPAWPVDTTGAGDAFCSAFVASLLAAPADLVRAAACGAVAASFAISAYGADGLFAATPTQAEARLRSWEFRKASEWVAEQA